MCRKSPEEGTHQGNVHHGAFIDYQEIAVERVVLIAAETPGSRLNFQEAVNRLCFEASCFAESLCGPTRRRTKNTANLLRPHDGQQRMDQGCLADSGSACDDRQPTPENLAQRFALALG